MTDRRTLELLGRACPRCSIHHNDPHLIEACWEIGEKCWEKCPVCIQHPYL